MTGFLDGTEIDLDRVQVASNGGQWLWSCDLTESGDPLMMRIPSRPGAPLVPLSDIYQAHGPLMARPAPPTAAMYRQVLEAAS